MDQLKVALAALKKHHFWVLCGVVVIVAVVIWTKATADLVNQYNTRKTTLEGLRSAVKTVQGVAQHPNEKVVAAIKDSTQRLKGEVYNAWEFLHHDQKANNQWPAELRQDFLDMINSLKPDEDIPPQYLERYHNFIIRHFPALFEIIDVRLPALLDENGQIKKDAAGRAMKINPFTAQGIGAMEGSNVARRREWIGKVVWNEADLRRVKAAFDWEQRPTSQQVRLAQEDLWVYEALLRIIKQTNEGATSHYNAAVKKLETLEIGRAAAEAYQKSSARIMGSGGGMMGVGPAMGMPGQAPGPAMGGEGPMPPAAPPMEGATPAGAPMPGAAPMPGGPGTPAAQPGTSLLDFRYVDQNLQPLPASAPAPFAEFKMMLIHMVLVMDQSKIPKLLVNCANSSMPVEVRTVSLRPGQGRQISLDRLIAAAQQPAAASGQPGAMPIMPGMPGMPGMMEGYSSYAGPGPMATPSYGPEVYGASREEGLELRPNDLPVEIFGIIYIFNPPDIAKLGTGTADKQSATAAGPAAVEAAAPAATPAAGPAAAPPTAPSPAPAAAPATPGAPAPAGPPAAAPASAPAAAPAPAGAPAAAPAAVPAPAAPAGVGPAAKP